VSNADKTKLSDSPRGRRGGSDRRERARSRRDEARAREATARRQKIVAIAAAAIVVVIVTMIAIKALTPTSTTTADTGPVSPAVLRDLTTVSDATSNAIGQGSATSLPIPVRGPMLRGPSGLPQIVYIGAEYCPYCAAERWGMIVALSRFGSFTGLRTARSAADDVYPSTPTFTFYGSTYKSPYVEFTAVETQTSTRVGGTYQTLQTPTPEQQHLIDTYDAPPYVASGSAGAIPFVDIANQYVISGSTINPGMLDNRSWESIAASVASGNSDDARAIVGTANVITAAICASTADSPSDVCSQPAIKQIEATLAKTPAPKASR
jgi:hypothetical protein